MDIKMKDLKTLLCYMRMTVNSDKRFSERLEAQGRVDGYYIYLQKRIEELEPIIEDLEKQLKDMRVPIKFI